MRIKCGRRRDSSGPTIKERATEMWVYPGGWQLYFDADRLVDLTVVGKPPL